MKTISSKEFATAITDRIEDDLNHRLLITYNSLAETYGFERARSDEFDDAWYAAGIGPELRDLAVDLFEVLGMDIRPDGRDF